MLKKVLSLMLSLTLILLSSNTLVFAQQVQTDTAVDVTSDI